MKIRVWKVILFVIVILAVTISLFPTRRSLIPYYERAGKWADARAIIDELLGRRPQDVPLLIASADAYQAEGRPEQAITMIEAALKLKPGDIRLLTKLAEYCELDRQPDRAVAIWEEVIRKDGDNRQAYTRLAALYRYRGDSVGEAGAVSRLIALEAKDGGKPLRNEHVLARMMKEAILALSRPDIAGDKTDPYLRAVTINALYARLLAYLGDVEDGNDSAAVRKDGIEACLAALVTGERGEEARRFAAAADRDLGLGIFSRLTLARLFSTAGEGGTALAILQALKNEHPRRLDIWQAVAETAAEIKDTATTRAALEQVVALAPADGEARKKLAAIYVQTGDFARAYESYTAGKEQGNGQAIVLEILRQALAGGNRELAMAAALYARNRRPGDLTVALAAGDVYLSVERPDLAYPLYRRAVSGGRKDRQFILKLMNIAGFTNREEIIADAAALARAARPADPEILRRSGEILIARGRLQSGIAAYLAYLRLKPQDREIMRRAAEVYEWLEQPGQAYALYRKLAAAPGADKELLRKAARLAEGTGCDEDAFRAYLRLWRTYPQDKTLRGETARLALWTKRPKYAAALLGTQSDEEPGNYQKAMEAGRAHAEADQLDRGVVFFERAAALRPEDMELRHRLATYYGWLGKRDKQLAALEYLESRKSLTRDERRSLAELYLERREGKKALKHLDVFAGETRLPPREGMMLVYAYVQTKQEGAALKTLDRLARENVRDAKLLAELGDEALGIRQTDAALRFYEAALRLEPRNTQALKGSAQIYAWNNDPRRAIRRFEAHNRIKGQDIEARFQLGELYTATGDDGRAYGEFKKTRRLIAAARQKQGIKQRLSPPGKGTNRGDIER